MSLTLAFKTVSFRFAYLLDNSTSLIATSDDKQLIILCVNFNNLRLSEYVADQKSSFSFDLFQVIKNTSYLGFVDLTLFKQYKPDLFPGISYHLLLPFPQQTFCIGLEVALLNSSLTSLTLNKTDFTIIYLEEDIETACHSFLEVDANPMSMGIFKKYLGSS